MQIQLSLYANITQLSLYANNLCKVVKKKLNTPKERWSKKVNTIDPHCSWIPFKINTLIVHGFHSKSILIVLLRSFKDVPKVAKFESLAMHVRGEGPTRAHSAFSFRFWSCKQVAFLQPIQCHTFCIFLSFVNDLTVLNGLLNVPKCERAEVPSRENAVVQAQVIVLEDQC